MKATSIVRRIDNKGRIAFPKELRRQLQIHDGDPLEFFIDTVNTAIVIKKYCSVGNEDWHKIKMVLRPILVGSFAIYDICEKQVANSGVFPHIPFNDCLGQYRVTELKHDGDTVGYLVSSADAINIEVAQKVVSAMIEG